MFLCGIYLCRGNSSQYPKSTGVGTRFRCCNAVQSAERLRFCLLALQDLTLKHGWRTGAIIPELRKEIKIMNTEPYVHMMSWLQALTGLIEQMQVRPNAESSPFLVFLPSFLFSSFVSLPRSPRRCTGIRHLRPSSRSGSKNEPA